MIVNSNGPNKSSDKGNVFLRLISEFVKYNYPKKVVKDFQDWLADEEHAQEKSGVLWKLWNGIDGKSDKNLGGALRKVKIRIGLPAGRSFVTFRKVVMGAAAVLIPALIFIGVVDYSSDDQRIDKTKTLGSSAVNLNVMTASEDMKNLLMTDGTEVVVNKDSEIRYSDRYVSLEGEAYFKVKSNQEKPFIVTAKDVIVTVLGTEFNINTSSLTEGGELATKITLYKGVLNIESPAGMITLHSGSEYVYGVESRTADISQVNVISPEWASQKVVFDRVKMGAIFDYIEKKFSVKVECSGDKIRDVITTLKLNGNESLEKVMFLLQMVSGEFSYTIEKDKVVVKTNII